MKVFLEYSDSNIKALCDAHPEIIEREEDDQNIICFQDALDVSLACEYLLSLDIATYIDSHHNDDKVYKACKQAIINAQPSKVLQALVDSSEVLFSLKGDAAESLLGCFIVILAAIPNEERLDLVKQLVARLSSSTEDSVLRAKLFSLLFNNLSSHDIFRYYVYDSLVVFLGKVGKVASLKPQINQLDEWFGEWGVDMEQKRTLYKHFFEAAQQCEESDFAMKFIFKYLGSFDGESPEVLDAARDSAISCISSVIKVPKVFQMDHLLDFDVVNNLNGHPSYDLLDIFVNGNLEDYYKFYGENSDLISKLDLDHNSNVRKMRLLTLISLAHGKNEVEYSLIETSLQLRREDIEVWIINAIGAELLEGKLDQMNSKLLVRRAIYRNFSTSHWQQIYDRLSTWQANIASLLESLE